MIDNAVSLSNNAGFTHWCSRIVDRNTEGAAWLCCVALPPSAARWRRSLTPVFQNAPPRSAPMPPMSRLLACMHAETFSIEAMEVELFGPDGRLTDIWMFRRVAWWLHGLVGLLTLLAGWLASGWLAGCLRVLPQPLPARLAVLVLLMPPLLLLLLLLPHLPAACR